MNNLRNILEKNFEVLIKLLGLTILIATGLYFKGWTLTPEVWGTVSDWIMVIVTGLTAIFLYQSLQSQQEIQKMQQSITILDNHIHNIRPDFSCTIEWVEKDGEYFQARLHLEIIENIPFKLHYKFVQTSKDFTDISGHKGMVDYQSTQIGTIIPFKIRFKTLSDAHGLVGSLDLFFEDAIGTGYLTKFMLTSTKEGAKKAGPMIQYFPDFIISEKLKNLLRQNSPEQLAHAKKFTNKN